MSYDVSRGRVLIKAGTHIYLLDRRECFRPDSRGLTSRGRRRGYATYNDQLITLLGYISIFKKSI